jgi:hypothetical protein
MRERCCGTESHTTSGGSFDSVLNRDIWCGPLDKKYWIYIAFLKIEHPPANMGKDSTCLRVRKSKGEGWTVAIIAVLVAGGVGGAKF